MSPSTAWGPPIWRFFHCLAENIKDEMFSVVGPAVFGIMKQICKNLPCPICSVHATTFLSSVKFQFIKNKRDFVLLLFIFHNTVRKRKGQSIFSEAELSMYKNCNVGQYFNQFVDAYNTKGHMKLMSDSFAREITIRQVKQFLIKYKQLFLSPNSSISIVASTMAAAASSNPTLTA